MGCECSKNEQRCDIVSASTLNNFDTRSRYSYRRVQDDFICGTEVIGVGKNGHVTKVVNRFTEQVCALKVLKKHHLNPTQLDNLRDEVNNYLRIDHPHIARLLHVYEDPDNVSLIMELCGGKELYAQVVELKPNLFPEEDVQHMTIQMARAIAYLHNHNFVHCDIKLENFVYDGTTGNVFLIDFGFSKTWDHHGHLTSMQGTECYAAPEVFLRDYTDKCDLWSLGVVVFILLSGYPPFSMTDTQECRKNIMIGSYTFREDRWGQRSAESRDFVKRLLVVDPEQRMSAIECFEHSWLAEIEAREREEMSPFDDLPDASPARAASPARSHSSLSGEGSPRQFHMSHVGLLDDMRKFKEASHLKRAALEMMAHHLTSERLEKVRAAFMALDCDHNGAISREHFKAAFGNLVQKEEELWAIFDVVDVDHDGELNYSEFAAAILMSNVEIADVNLRETFQLFDVDHTGFITKQDLARVFGGAKARYEDADLDTLLREFESDSKGISFRGFVEHLMGDEKKLVSSPSTAAIYKAGPPRTATLKSGCIIST